MMKKFLLVATVLAMMASSAFAAKKIGAFKAEDLEGAAHDEALFRQATLTMFNVWGTFCPPCLHEMPDLGRLAKEMAPEGVQIVGLLYDWFDPAGRRSEKQIAKAKTLVERTGADYLHLLLDDGLARYLGDFSAIPQTFFVNGRGEIVGEATGARSAAQWREIIREMQAKAK
ncbi:TlpA disulfide reductase family protein [Pyramidobacter sp.]|uniref:TlpA family protein disulfide reductase n=2 Tax=Pyramidobacter sp. TaxID=1943581 RepID=UPI002A74CDC3|nr:TlpA disulfide reductase family protein [Pyramidobacter sp.]